MPVLLLRFLSVICACSDTGLTVNGGYAEYAVNAAGGWMKVPNPVTWSPLEAASVMCTYGTVWHAAFTRGRCVGYIGDHTRHKCTHWLRGVAAPIRTSLSTLYPPIYRSNSIDNRHLIDGNHWQGNSLAQPVPAQLTRSPP